MDGRKAWDQAQYQTADDEEDGIGNQQRMRDRRERQDRGQ